MKYLLDFQQLSALIGQQNEAFFIFDTARAHFNVPDPHENHQCKTLPPYSPQLNLTELAFSTVKAFIKRNLAEQFREGVVVPENMNAAEHRRQLLINLGHQAVQTITPQFCRNWFNHCRSFLPACIEMEDFPN